MPVGHVLVGDARRDIEHDDRALTLDAAIMIFHKWMEADAKRHVWQGGMLRTSIRLAIHQIFPAGPEEAQ